MPVQPVVSKSFETANGLRATVKIKYDKPDINGILYSGVVKLNGDDQVANWRSNGVSPIADYTLNSLWPADDKRQYQPMTETDDGIPRALGSYYADLGSLKHDWLPKGTKLAVKFDKVDGVTTAEIVSLT